VSGAIAATHAFLAVMRRDLYVYMSYRTRIVSQVLTSIFSLTLFYYVSRLVHLSSFRSSSGYFGFVVVGLSLVSVMYACFMIPDFVRQELVAGTFDRMVLSPFGAVRGVVAMTLFPLLLSFALAVMTLGIGCIMFGLQLHWSTVPLSLPVLALALLAFLPFGLLFAALTLIIKQGNVGTSWVIALMALTGGVYFPLTVLHLLVNTPLTASPAASLLKLAVFAGVLLPASVLVLSRAIRLGQRRGTIIEY
jgi:ABC-2 type transport system permease protein